MIVGGVEDVPGATMFDKMAWLRANRDDLRLRMLREPRGYPAANCNLILPPTNPAADAGYVIMEQVEYPGMSGTNTICVVTVLLETGMLPMTEPVTELTLESPAGLIRVTAECAAGKVSGVTFRNVPAFATHIAVAVEVPQLGTVTVDVAYGGMFYVIADAEPFGLRLTPDEGRDIVRISEMVKAAAAEQLPVVHPEQPGFLRGSRSPSSPVLRTIRVQRPAQRRDRLDRQAGLGAPGDLDRGDRSIALRDGDVRTDGRAPREGPAAASATPSATKGSWGRSSPAACWRKRRSAPTGPSFRASPARPGSPDSRRTSSTRPIRSPTASRSGTSGSPRDAGLSETGSGGSSVARRSVRPRAGARQG